MKSALVCFISVSLYAGATLSKPSSYHLVEGTDPLEVLQARIDSSLRHKESATNARFRADLWTGIGETAGFIGRQLAPVGKFKGDAINLVTKVGRWDANRIADAEEAAAKGELYSWLDNHRDKVKNDLHSNNPKQVIEEFEKHRGLNSKMYAKLTSAAPEVAARVAVVQLDALTDLVSAGTERTSDKINELRKDVVEKSKSLDENMTLMKEEQREGFSDVFVELNKAAKNRKEILEKAKELTTLQREMSFKVQSGQTDILELGNKIFAQAESASTSGQLLVLQEFKRMPLEQQLRELDDEKSLWKPQLKNLLNVEKYEKAIKIQKLRSDIASAATNVAAGVNAIGQIANTLGWKIAEKKEFNDAVKYTGAIASAVAGFATMGPMGLVGPVMSLFGGGGGPSEGERQILEKLAEMDEKLDDLLDGQQKILLELEKSTKQLVDLNKEILRKSDDIIATLDLIQEQMAYAVKAIIDYSDVPLNLSHCANFKDSFKPVGASYLELQKLFNNTSVSYGKCQSVIDKLIPIAESNIRKGMHAYFDTALVTKKDTGGKLSLSLEQVRKDYRPLLTVLWASYGLPKDKSKWSKSHERAAAELIATLISPSDSFDDLRGKSISFRDDSYNVLEAFKELGLSKNIEDIFLSLIETGNLIEVVDYLILVSSIKPLVNPAIPNKLLEKQNLSIGKLYEKQLNSQYTFALQAVNIGIAQQTLLTGDFLIPQIADIVFSEKSSKEKDDMLLTVSRSMVLSENLAIYAINNSLKQARRLPQRKFEDITRISTVEVNDRAQQSTLYDYNVEHYHRLWSGKLKFSGSATCIEGKEESHGWPCILPERWKIKGRKIEVKNSKNVSYFIDLPSSSQLTNDELSVQPQLNRLLSLKKRLLVSADMFNIEKPLTSDNRQLWTFPVSAFDF